MHPTKGFVASLEDTTIQLTFRCPKELIDLIDAMRAKRKGKVSRNQAIIELLEKQIMQQQHTQSQFTLTNDQTMYI